MLDKRKSTPIMPALTNAFYLSQDGLPIDAAYRNSICRSKLLRADLSTPPVMNTFTWPTVELEM